MLTFLSLSTLAVFAYIYYNARSVQAFVLLILLLSYQMVLLLSIYLDIPLDIFSASDDYVIRFSLAKLNLLFFVAVAVGAAIPVREHCKDRNPITINPSLGKIFFMVLCAIAIVEPFIMVPAAVSGNYSNDKPGYFFEYANILFALYFVSFKPKKFIMFFPFALHFIWCVLAGERMMILTAGFCLLFYVKPRKVTLKALFGFVIFGFAMLILDKLRSGSSDFSNLYSQFLYSGAVTHHGSLLYSSMVLLDFANSFQAGILKIFSGFSFIFGIDGSTSGTAGLAGELGSFGQRGGGGLISAYLPAVFGVYLGTAFSVTYAFFLGRILRRHSDGFVLSTTALVFVSFCIHTIVYTPVLALKPLIITLILLIMIKLFYPSPLDGGSTKRHEQ